jgi:predicted enzyme related to lactoylglutathione lyase
MDIAIRWNYMLRARTDGTQWCGPRFLHIVDDMDALLDRLKQERVEIDAKRINESYGRFAWIYDQDGNKIELWQPVSAKP